MRVAVFGSKNWKNYPDLMRHLTILIQESAELGHDKIVFVHGGRLGAENMITEYVGKTEKFLRQKNFKIKEELFRDKTDLSDVRLIESGIDFALIFSTNDKRSFSCKKLLEAYNVPARILEYA
jgi:hypothetical protein